MYEISNNDFQKVVHFLSDAATFYEEHAQKPKEIDRARLINNLCNKIKNKRQWKIS